MSHKHNWIYMQRNTFKENVNAPLVDGVIVIQQCSCGAIRTIEARAGTAAIIRNAREEAP
jgi:hypothetical protein